jgi:acetyltransferase-like isoleucine patch superfamily enzyme
MREDPRYREYRIGRFSYGCPAIRWKGAAQLEIGSFCSIANGVTIILGGNHRTDWISTFPFSSMRAFKEYRAWPGHPMSKGDVVIGNDVWIGEGATIMSGVTIGHGAVIGAKAVVAKSISPYTIVVGNPARVVRQRFPADAIKQLLEVEWWNWPIEEVRANAGILMSSDIAALVDAANSNRRLRN